MSEFVLADHCTVNTNIDTDTFVGVKAVNGDITINFPLGYRLSEDDKEVRRDILLLLNVLSGNSERRDSEISKESDLADMKLPVHEYLYVISDYYSRGYYKEREVSYQTSRKGKINWGRTIKTQKAYIQDDEAFYLDFITKRENINDNELITLIHEYCVYESFQKLGWLFSAYMPEKPRIRFNRKLFISVVKKKISETFNDRNKTLFRNLLVIISSMGDDGSVSDYRYGTYRFEYVWESMIDKAFGIKSKENYFPRTSWILADGAYEKSPLEPDTIMLFKNKVYVLDAKYYKYGWSGAAGHLPGSSSISKQITYGEYIAESEEFRKKNNIDKNPTVYNAFIMPFDSFNNRFKTEDEMYCIGSAISEWKSSDGTKPYEKVAGILLDVKSLMENYSISSDRIMRLAEIIEKSVGKND